MLRVVLAFAAGAAAGAYFVKWYIERNPGAIVGRKLGDQIFGEGSTGAKILGGIGTAIDEARAS
jgi:hypothetical protein